MNKIHYLFRNIFFSFFSLSFHLFFFWPSPREQYSRTFSFYSVSLCRMQIHLGVVYEANFEDDQHFSKITLPPRIDLLLAPISPSSSRFVFLLFHIFGNELRRDRFDFRTDAAKFLQFVSKRREIEIKSCSK